MLREAIVFPYGRTDWQTWRSYQSIFETSRTAPKLLSATHRRIHSVNNSVQRPSYSPCHFLSFTPCCCCYNSCALTDSLSVIHTYITQKPATCFGTQIPPSGCLWQRYTVLYNTPYTNSTLHCMLHYTTLCITLYNTFYTTLYTRMYTTLYTTRYTLHYITLYYTLHYALHYTVLHPTIHTTLQCILHYTTPYNTDYTTLHYTTLYTTLSTIHYSIH
jgi:hypothetical protein